MKLTLEKERSSPQGDERPLKYRAVLKNLLLSWELYLILAVAAFLRFYLLQTTEFDDDQAAVFGMADNAIRHGMLVATSNIASIHIVNPPAVIYLYMLPALLSANPLSGAIFTALCNTLAVGLCYCFVRHYYGRLAATIAALSFATATLAVFYSRFIWQQNLLPLFVMLYIFCLFVGVVERRKGWLFPALVLLGLLVQLHASTVLLGATLLVALVFSPGTLRWRDLALGVLGLLIIYCPYILWEISSKFQDIHILLSATKHHTQVKNLTFFYYQLFLSPYNPQLLPADPHAMIYAVLPWVRWLAKTMLWLMIGGATFALLRVLWPHRRKNGRDTSASTREGTEVNGASSWVDRLPVVGSMKYWWIDLYKTPQKCGLLVLLAWQVVPVLVLSHLSLIIYPHYFIFFMPGQFILIGILLGQIVEWCRRFQHWDAIARYAVIFLTIFITVAQFAASLASVVDYGLGHYNELQIGNPYYDDLSSLQHAMTLADQVAQRNHLNHVYMTTNPTTQAAMSYLAKQMHTPTTLFDDSRCLVLPNLAAGPAVMLVNPYSTLSEALLAHFTTAKLVAEPQRLGGPPFHLYIVNPLPQATPVQAFAGHLQLLNTGQPTLFSAVNTSWYVTRWSLLDSVAAHYRTNYSYQLQETPNGNQPLQRTATCMLTSMRAGDQVLIAFHVPPMPRTVSFVLFSGQFYQSSPYNLSYGPITMETYINRTRHIALGSIHDSSLSGSSIAIP